MMKAHGPTQRHITHNIEFKRQVAQDYLAGQTLHSLARRYDLSRNLTRIWVREFEGGAFDDKAAAVDTIEAYEARIAALERLIGRQALEIEFLERFPADPIRSGIPKSRHVCFLRVRSGGMDHVARLQSGSARSGD
jgi:transposase-like protein